MARLFVVTACVALLAVGLGAQQPKGTTGMAATHALMTPDEVTWTSAPSALPSGAELAVLDGDPMSSGPFTIRLKVPAGYKIPPHWHPTDEDVTIVEGTVLMGMGDQMSESSAKSLSEGSFAKMPKTMHHFAMAKDAAVIQISGAGPFAITYVNPSDDPRNVKR